MNSTMWETMCTVIHQRNKKTKRQINSTIKLYTNQFSAMINYLQITGILKRYPSLRFHKLFTFNYFRGWY